MIRILVALSLLFPLLAHAVPADQCVAGRVGGAGTLGVTSTLGEFTPCYTVQIPQQTYNVGEPIDVTYGATYWCGANATWTIVSGGVSGATITGAYGRYQATPVAPTDVPATLTVRCTTPLGAYEFTHSYVVQDDTPVYLLAGVPQNWEQQPDTRCRELVDAGATCGDGALFCVNPGAGWQSAVQAAHDDSAFGPGDAIALRGGNYPGTTNGIGTAEISLTKNGANDSSRLHLCNYPGEVALSVGVGGDAALAESNWNDQTNATLPSYDRQTFLKVLGDFWRVESDDEGLLSRWYGTSHYGVVGDFVDLYGIDARYQYSTGRGIIQTGYDSYGSPDDTTGPGPDGRYGTADDTPDGIPDTVGLRVKWSKGLHAYHSNFVTVHNSGTPHHEALHEFDYNIALFNGYEADYDRVRVIGGDPSTDNGINGSGNADHFAFRVVCYEQSPTGQQLCYEMKLRRNYMAYATDDCIDQQVDYITIGENVIRACGPLGNRGIKVKAVRPGFLAYRNLCHMGTQVDSTACFEGAGAGAGLESRHYANSAFYTVGPDALNDYGMDMQGGGIWRDNAASFNFINIRTGAGNDGSNIQGDIATWWADAVATYNDMAALTTMVDRSDITHIEKLATLFKDIYDDYTPQAASGALNTGSETDRQDFDGNEVMCQTAMDAPGGDPTAQCAQWCGSAPDKGAVQACADWFNPGG